MAKLEYASVEQLRRLLNFFPATDLKEEWVGLKGLKRDDVVEAAAKTKDAARISKFIRERFGRCRQHVLIVERPDPMPDLLSAFPAVDQLGSTQGGVTFYLAAIPFTMYLLSPFEPVEVQVLWPLRIELRDKIVIVRSVIVEREPANYSGRTVLKSTHEIDEKSIIEAMAKMGFLPYDLNKGVKAYWHGKKMDAYRSSYKKSKSTSTVVMDEGIGLRDNEPDTYNEIISKPLLNNSFRTDASVKNSLKTFQINATFGRLGFTSYTEDPGDADAVIEAILAGNS